ncbi:hypothetical protein CAPTEDRAFT_160521 [Capitella teleta]|uniref:ATP-dependent RNA helicase n=1 Tax=Capitella teleta TaxID=283909 RepID=R7U3B4_CAPTE|nr:hypothetical protein CAPTEDRAFT_160521 [Capitella teleta]|eukprot:ELT98171.1 hypothetical protein CAPTEDRAFT_160521 [Capitella teleta]
MVSNLEAVLKVKEMTEVQKQSIPWVIAGRDVLIKSQTGSGKTLCYAVPIVHLLQKMEPRVSREHGVYSLVIVPTRELAVQSLELFQKLTRPFTWIVPGAIMGGEKKKSEKSRLRKGINILICTPGRLADHLQNTESLGLSNVKWLVIDEADRHVALLEMGFQKDVSQIVDILQQRGSADRNTLLLSATLSKGVEELACMSLQNPVRVDMVQSDGKSSSDGAAKEIGDAIALPEHLSHHYMVTPSKLRLVTLAAFIMWKCKLSNKRSKVLVFMSTQQSVDFHYDLFHTVLGEGETSKLNLFKLHGEMAQKERTQVFQEFSKLKDGLLLCTDVASRGLDMPRVKWIIQYTPPATATDYVHRVGRTARIGGHGNALLFLLPSEVDYIKVLAEQKVKIESVPMDDVLETLRMHAASLAQGSKIKHVKTVEECCAALQMKLEDCVSKNKEMTALAGKAYQSAIRAYAAYPAALKHIFHKRFLHLGHMAKSFALLEDPTMIGNIVNRQHQKDHGSSRNWAPQRKKPLTQTMSEFDSGFSAPPKKKAKAEKEEET